MVGKSDCSNCVSNYTAKLIFLPKSWRVSLAEVLCSITGQSTIACEEVKTCETLTELSPFSINGTNVCISYKDEKGVTVERCQDFNLLLNSSLDNIDPKCVTTFSEWASMNFSDRIQAIINTYCGIDTTSSTTTTSSSTSTTTSPASACKIYTVGNPTSNMLPYSYVACDGENTVIHEILGPNSETDICAVTDSIAAAVGIEIDITGICTPPSTTTTTTQAPTSSTTTTTTSGGSTSSTSSTSSTTSTTTAAPVCTAYVLKNIGVINYNYIYNDCDGNTQGGTLAPGQSTSAFCAISNSIFAEGLIEINQYGTCISGQPCNEFIITNNSGSNKTVSYQDCETGTNHQTTLGAGNQLVVCAIIGSVSVSSCPSCTIVANGVCSTPSTTTTTTLPNNVSVTNTLGTVGISNVTGISGFTFSGPVNAGGTAYGHHNAFTGTIVVTLTGTAAVDGNLSLAVNGSGNIVQCFFIPAGTGAGTYTFNSRTYLSTDTIDVQGNTGHC
jgi:hypothetical protein